MQEGDRLYITRVGSARMAARLQQGTAVLLRAFALRANSKTARKHGKHTTLAGSPIYMALLQRGHVANS